MDADEKLFSDVMDNLVPDSNMTFLEFGVASGNTMCAWLNVLINKDKVPKHVFGFDSFSNGLPEEQLGVPTQNDWVVGAFNLVDEVNNNKKLHQVVKDTSEAFELVKKRLSYYNKYGINVDFVRGYYNKTLNTETVLTHNIKPAIFVNIDVDVYISAKQVLNFLFDNNLLVESCIVHYDDWFMRGVAIGKGGESKAHYEAVSKYNVNFEELPHHEGKMLFRYLGKNK